MAFSGAGSAGYLGLDGVVGIDLNSLFLHQFLDERMSFDLVFAAFQGTFAVITVALISGAIADRARFGSWMLFAGIWATLVYFPIAGWVFNFTLGEDGQVIDGGWLVKDVGLLDFAGGTVVEVGSGAAALAVALVLGKRFGFRKGMYAPHNVPLTLIGAAILWFGWFAFNAGSQLAADGIAALAFLNTLIAPAAAMLSWSLFERITAGKPTAVGIASAAIAGAVAITPSCAFLDPVWAIVLGLVVGVVCAWAIELKFALGFDDSLDVVGIHLVGGIVGTLFIGLFGRGVGFFFGHSAEQLIAQFIGVLSIGLYSFVTAYLIAMAIEKTIGFRVQSIDEEAGIDPIQHGQLAYHSEDPRWRN
jgi:Amt family ammonium transporter